MITFEILVDDLKKNSSGQKYIDFNKKIVNLLNKSTNNTEKAE